MKSITVSCVFLVWLLAGSAMAQPAASIEDLDWMTGNWAGDLGPNQLEENWVAPEGGSIAALVRMTGNGDTSMFEMITIEESGESLVLHIQQFDAGFEARTEMPQEMELVEIGERSVQFEAVSEGGMSSLGYSRPEPDTFMIHIERPDGSSSDIELTRRSLWQ